MNNVELIGRLIKKPMLSYTQSGKAVLHFTLAVDNPFSKDAQADLVNVEQWNKPAETSANYLVKGEQVAITGALRTYKDSKSGLLLTKVVANNVEFLSSKAEVAALEQKNAADEQAVASQQATDFQQGAPVQQ